MISNNLTLEKLKGVFHQVLGVSEQEVSLATNMQNLKAWDSLNHLNIIVKIEEVFNITFEALEIIELNSLEKIILTIESKIKN